MLRMLLSLFSLVSVGCATAPKFEIMENCIPLLMATDGSYMFSCTEPDGKRNLIEWKKATDLLCFHYADFKNFAEECREE